MKVYSTLEIVDQFIGAVHPVGDSSEDDRRYDNLEELISLTDRLITKIEQVAEMRNYNEASVKRSAELAHNYRNRLTGYGE